MKPVRKWGLKKVHGREFKGLQTLLLRFWEAELAMLSLMQLVDLASQQRPRPQRHFQPTNRPPMINHPMKNPRRKVRRSLIMVQLSSLLRSLPNRLRQIQRPKHQFHKLQHLLLLFPVAVSKKNISYKTKYDSSLS
jgi:hypothetical protein